MPAGDLIADAKLDATAPAGFGQAVHRTDERRRRAQPWLHLRFSAVGEGDGNITYGEAFTAQPFGNSLVTDVADAHRT